MGQQPSSPEIISSSNEISQFHKDFSGIICTASLCSPGGKDDLTSFSLFFLTLKIFLVIYYHISLVLLVTLDNILLPNYIIQLLRAKFDSSTLEPKLDNTVRCHAYSLYQ